MSNNPVDIMKICVTAKGSGIDAQVEERFGRAPYFVFIDEESGDAQTVQNAGAGGAGGVGIKSAQTMVDNDAKVVITGQVGGNANSALSAAGIAVYEYRAGGSVKDAVAAYRAGTLARIL
ncbi:Dinitrogenase iron-molybdenum cofactor biosynthesis protein [Methanofollis liminatans DSM 4140]|jgi:predicted Fe-Mo cluster-binding NifX family protein|uniref:Dinitrogenase iron-molybdenum cofactor biosynthesis protein n=2 Tax=Methanofollis liminatans TaxID=2201 RepID=J1L3C1_9EURY|nr:Dinitrogenase iron-molybdenum cofactor biosynthesis protein [Methanofollis liminatans DSM 4140]